MYRQSLTKIFALSLRNCRASQEVYSLFASSHLGVFALKFRRINGSFKPFEGWAVHKMRGTQRLALNARQV